MLAIVYVGLVLPIMHHPEGAEHFERNGLQALT
jgi:hypothetical protein